MVSTVWPVSRFLFLYPQCHSCPAICKSGARAPVPYGVGASGRLKIRDLSLMEPTLGVDIKAISKLIWHKNCNGTVVKCLFHIIYYLARWNFVISVSHLINRSLSILYNTMHLPDEFVCNGQSFGRMFSSFHARRDAVFNQFVHAIH